MAMNAVGEQSHEFFMCKMREVSKALYGPHWWPKTEKKTYCYGITRDSVQPDIVSSKLPGCRTAVTWLRPDLTYRSIANILSYYKTRKRAPGIFSSSETLRTDGTKKEQHDRNALYTIIENEVLKLVPMTRYLWK